MKNVDIIKIKKELNKYVVKNPKANRIDVINYMLNIIEEIGFSEIPVDLLRFVMAIPLEVSII